MKIILFFLRLYYRILSALWPSLAAGQAYRLFQRPLNHKLRAAERAFLEAHPSRILQNEDGAFHVYEWGNPTGRLVVLVHGWDSNAGSLSGIGNRLAALGFRVVALDLPGFGQSQQRYTNLFKSSRALATLLADLSAEGKVSIVSHSFGSAVTARTLESYDLEVDQVIFLSSPNEMEVIFRDFQKLIHLGERAYQQMLALVEQRFGQPVSSISVAGSLQQAHYRELLIIHDRADKVLPFENAVALYEAAPKAHYLPLEQVGHYRMLWNEQVGQMVCDQLTGTLSSRYGYASLDYRV